MNESKSFKIGLQSIDVATRGFLPGELIFIGGRPAMGKTVLALDLILNQKSGKNFIYVQLENDIARTNELLRLKASHLGLELDIIENDLTSEFSEIVVGSSKHVLLHLENPTMLDLFERLTYIVQKREIDGVIIDSFSFIKPHIIPLRNPKKDSEALRYLKVMAINFQLPIFLFSNISRKVEKKQKYELALSRYGSQIPVADWVFMLFRWEYYGLEECLDGTEVSVGDAMLAVVKSKRLTHEYQPRLKYDYDTVRFVSAKNDWYDYLEKKEVANHASSESAEQ